MGKTWKVLSVGNSFSIDTMEHLADIAKAAGYTDVVLGNLYIGGCSIRRHMDNAQKDAALYEFLTNRGEGWSSVVEHPMSAALRSETWDVVSIQHGTADGSRNSDATYYDKLPELVSYIKRIVGDDVKIAFNMTWVGEPYHTHPEIVAFGGDCQKLFETIASVMKDTVMPTKGIDMVSPTGTAIQNARTVLTKDLTRDGYHLSLDVGRYIAGLTFFKALTGEAVDNIDWVPDGVDEQTATVCKAAASAAINTPFAVTNLTEK